MQGCPFNSGAVATSVCGSLCTRRTCWCHWQCPLLRRCVSWPHGVHPATSKGLQACPHNLLADSPAAHMRPPLVYKDMPASYAPVGCVWWHSPHGHKWVVQECVAAACVCPCCAAWHVVEPQCKSVPALPALAARKPPSVTPECPPMSPGCPSRHSPCGKEVWSAFRGLSLNPSCHVHGVVCHGWASMAHGCTAGHGGNSVSQLSCRMVVSLVAASWGKRSHSLVFAVMVPPHPMAPSQ